MSRIGKRILEIPQAVKLNITDNYRQVAVTGPLGTINYQFSGTIAIAVKDQKLTTKILNNSQQTLMLHGTVNSLLKNAIYGVVKGYQKILVIEGLGYKFQLKDQILVLEIGYSHSVEITIPDNLKLELISKRRLNIFGCDKQTVGLFASQIRKLRKCEPYKGKGIRYDKEVIKRKLGKTASK